MKRLSAIILACLTAFSLRAQTYSGNTVIQLDPSRPPDTGEAQKYGAAAIREIKRALLNSTIGTNALASSIANVKNFGATGSGVADDTVAVQASVDSGLPVYFPVGNYKIGKIVITNSVLIYGSGPNFEGTNGTAIWPSSSTATVFYVNTHAPVTFRDFSGTANLQQAYGGALIMLDDTTASGTANLFSRVENVVFDGLFFGVQAVRASSFSITHCTFWNVWSNGYGIFLDNQYNKDQGDQCIDGNTFNLAFTNSAGCIGWQGGGGTRIVNNKFFASPSLLWNMGGVTSNATGQLYINANSFDGVSSPGLAINCFNLSGTNTFKNIVISGNQFNSGNLNSFISISANATGTTGEIVISGNVFTVFPGGTVTGNGAISMSYATNFAITGNTIFGLGNANGILLTNCGVGLVSGNVITNWTSPILTNGSPKTIHIIDNY